MAFIRDTSYRDFPDSADLVELESLSEYDFGLRYTTDSHELYTFNEDIEISIDERNTLDQVEVLFTEEQYDEIVETVEAQLEADKQARKRRRR